MDSAYTLPISRHQGFQLMVLALLCAFVGLTRVWGHWSDPNLGFLTTDDAMRMVQVLDLKQGADWFDFTQIRLNPPAGVVMHWSRLPDLLPLGLLNVIEPLLGRDDAIRVVGVIAPPLMGILFFAAFVWAAAPLVDRSQLPAAGLVCLVLVVTQSAFAAGRLDHHGWQLTLAMFGAGAVIRVALSQSVRSALIVAGLAGALGLWVGAEAIPNVALIAAVLTMYWLWQGASGARSLAFYGVALTTGVLLIYPLHLRPIDWFNTSCDAFSLFSLGLAVAVLLFGIGTLLIERRTTRTIDHFKGALVLAVLLTMALWLAFPECRSGPYGQVSSVVAHLTAHTYESQSLLTLLVWRPAIAAFVFVLPLTALGLTLWHSLRTHELDQRRLWLGLALLITGAIVLQFWQLRASLLANAYAGIALSWWAGRVRAYAKTRQRRVWRMLLRNTPTLTILALPFAASYAAQVLSNKPDDLQAHHCDLTSVLPVLNAGPFTTEAPLLIAAPVNIGPLLLLKTPHAVLAAPYHRDGDGLQAMKTIMVGKPEQARAIAESRGVDLILTCGGLSTFLNDPDAPKPLLYEQLQTGDAPEWLTEIQLLGASDDLHLYRVELESHADDAP